MASQIIYTTFTHYSHVETKFHYSNIQMKDSKSGFWHNVSSNPIGSMLFSFVKNPIYFLYSGLGLFVVLISVEHSFSDAPTLPSYFEGNITFDKNTSHPIKGDQVTGNIKLAGNQQIFRLTATNSQTQESVFLQINQLKGIGTYFIPGDGDVENIGNLIKNLTDFSNKNNFYQAKLPNEQGVENGVGRVNITKITDKTIEGDLVIIGNNPLGTQAILESAKFKININK